MTDLEAQRLANLEHKQQLLARLNLRSHDISTTAGKRTEKEKGPATKKRRLDVSVLPARTSARIASAGVRPSYKEETGERHTTVAATSKPRPTSRTIKKEATVEDDLRTLIPKMDAEEIRSGWSKWTPSGRAPARDIYGTFHFDDQPLFTPNKSPEEMIREGSFGGSYFRPLKSRKLGIVVQDDWEELPRDWIQGLDTDKYLTSPTYDPEVNKFKVACGQSIEEWEAAGWIAHEYDIRGWFQWYCRFYLGRRCEDDERQVSRWRKCVGETGRWKRMLLKKYLAMGVREVFDDGEEEDGKEVSPVMHQTCHHWAYEVRQHDLDEVWGKT